MASQTKKRTVLSVEEKISVLDMAYDKTKTTAEILSYFSIGQSTFHKIKAQENLLRQAFETNKKLKRKRSRGSTYDELNQSLTHWFHQMRAQNVVVNGPLVKEKAQQLALAMNVDFKPSNGWLQRWKKSENITFQSVQGEKAVSDASAAEQWVQRILPTIDSGYEAWNIYNADNKHLNSSLSSTEEMSFKISELSTPCFLVDLQKVKTNCERMIETCIKLNIQLRPHTKTHKTYEGALLQTNGTKRCIAVSTLAEAEFYADNSFDDILLAYPVTEDKIKRCLKLVMQLDKFIVMVSGLDGLQCLENHIADLPDGKAWSVVVEVDLGYGRTGFLWDSEEIIQVATAVNSSPGMKLEQLYSHCGNSYAVKSRKEREELQTVNIQRLMEIRKKLGINCPIGVGSTPTCSLPIDESKSLSEFHPGNYFFYDYMQSLIGSCTESNIACRVMTRVIAHKQEKNMILVDCGFTALGHDGKKDRLPLDFCLIQGESNLKLIDMSQEIGKIVAKEGILDCRLYPVGTILYIFPYHSCCTSALHAEYQVHLGDEVIETWRPVRGW